MAFCEHDVAFAKRAWRLKEATQGGSQVGAVVVTPRVEVLGEGRSKLPEGRPFIGGGNLAEHVIHAEVNAIGNREVEGCTMYTTRFPCKDCADLINKKKIRRVVYVEDCMTNSGQETLKATSTQIPQELMSV